MNVPAPHRIIVSIFEEGRDYPAVVHIFYGRTLPEALGYFRAHMRTDSFLSDCVVRKRFANMACRAEQQAEHWDGRHWTGS